MTVKTFLYSLKVWLTSVAVAPAIFFVITFCTDSITHNQVIDGQHIGPLMFEYAALVIIELIMSFITWLIFLTITQLTISYKINPTIRRWLLFAAGIFLTIATFSVVLLPGDGVDISTIIIKIMLCNCLCIGWGSLFYDFEPVEA